MNDQYLKQVLTRRAENDIPVTVDVSNVVFRQLEAELTGKRKPASSYRLRWAALLIAILLISATTVYALVRGLIQPDPGITTMQIERKALKINQTHDITLPNPTVGTLAVKNLKVTVTEAYADSNRISVGYQITGLAEAGSEIKLYSNPTLVDAAQQPYIWLVGSSQQKDDITTDSAGEHFTHEGIMSFDASLLKTIPASISLTLKIEVAYTTANNAMAMLMAGATTFDFVVPMTSGRDVPVDQSVTNASQTIQANRAVITPSMTRLEICFSNPSVFNVDAWLAWETSATLNVNGQTIFTQLPAYFSGMNGQPYKADDACRSLVLPESLANQMGRWELTLDGFHNTDSGQTLAGKWTFAFDVK